MKIERAIEILNPEHRECYSGMEALVRQMEEENDLSSARKEMELYEKAVEKDGEIGTVDGAFRKMEKLAVALVEHKELLIHGKGETERVLENVQKARAGMEIALNKLHVLFGDCSDFEVRELEKLERSLKT